MTASAIEFSDMTMQFDSICAVDQLTLTIPKGIIFGFLGPNGAGKTTTIRLLLGLLPPTSGRATVLGLDTRLQAAEIRRRTGALLEHTGLYEQMTALENLEFYGRVNQLSATERQARSRQLLQGMGLWARRHDRVHQWSRGMKQKLALARAQMHRPSLLLLDEPTAGLDVAAAAAVREELARLAAQEGVTIFLTTHNMVEAEALCAQLAVIQHGKLIATGDPLTLKSEKGREWVTITAKNIQADTLQRLRHASQVVAANTQNGYLHIELKERAPVAPLIDLLVGDGVQVESVNRSESSLEEVFLILTGEEVA